VRIASPLKIFNQSYKAMKLCLKTRTNLFLLMQVKLHSLLRIVVLIIHADLKAIHSSLFPSNSLSDVNLHPYPLDFQGLYNMASKVSHTVAFKVPPFIAIKDLLNLDPTESLSLGLTPTSFHQMASKVLLGHLVKYMERVVIKLLTTTIIWTSHFKDDTLSLIWQLWLLILMCFLMTNLGMQIVGQTNISLLSLTI
jgi:hypothetical protein